MIHLVYETHMVDEKVVDGFKRHFESVNLISREVRWGMWANFTEKYTYFWKNYFLLAIKALRKSTPGDSIIVWQVFVGVVMAAINRIFNLKREIVILSFIFRKRSNEIVEFLRKTFVDFAIGGAQKVVCYSKYEEGRYRREFPRFADKFESVRLGLGIKNYTKKGISNGGAFIFAAGQSNRNYELIVNAMRFVDSKLIIATVNGVSIPDDLQERIIVVHPSEMDYLSLIKDAMLILIPLADPTISSGQLVLLHSMALGKACLISDSYWCTDYVQHKKSAYIVQGKTSTEWSDGINLILNNDTLRKSIERGAGEIYKTQLNSASFAEALINVLEANKI